MWGLLPLGMARECATKDCGGAAAWELEVGGVGSCYCNTCKEKISAGRTATLEDLLRRSLPHIGSDRVTNYNVEKQLRADIEAALMNAR